MRFLKKVYNILHLKTVKLKIPTLKCVPIYTFFGKHQN